MKIKLLLFLLSIINIYPAFSQINVTGKVVDQSQNVIPVATVSINGENRKQGARTNQDGTFENVLSGAGTYYLEVRFLGFYPYSQSYEFLENKSYDLGAIILTEFSQELQTVEVLGRSQEDYTSDYSFSATKTAIRNKELPQSLSTVTKESIADRQALQLADAVKYATGAKC